VITVQACRKFINNNSVTQAANMSSKSPELLARYCDLLLKKSSKNPEEAELEDTLNQVVGGDCLPLHWRAGTNGAHSYL